MRQRRRCRTSRATSSTPPPPGRAPSSPGEPVNSAAPRMPVSKSSTRAIEIAGEMIRLPDQRDRAGEHQPGGEQASFGEDAEIAAIELIRRDISDHHRGHDQREPEEARQSLPSWRRRTRGRRGRGAARRACRGSRKSRTRRRCPPVNDSRIAVTPSGRHPAGLPAISAGRRRAACGMPRPSCALVFPRYFRRAHNHAARHPSKGWQFMVPAGVPARLSPCAAAAREPMFDYLLNAFVTLFVTLDPPGLAPIFIVLTAGHERAARRQWRSAPASSPAPSCSASRWSASRSSRFLGISLPAFRIAGGLLLFVIAFEMVFERRDERKSARGADRRRRRSTFSHIAVFPLAIPLITGPGAISATVLLALAGHEPPQHASACSPSSCGWSRPCLRRLSARRTISSAILGETGRIVASRLLGLILAALAVQFVADGITALVKAAAASVAPPRRQASATRSRCPSSFRLTRRRCQHEDSRRTDRLGLKPVADGRQWACRERSSPPSCW